MTVRFRIPEDLIPMRRHYYAISGEPHVCGELYAEDTGRCVICDALVPMEARVRPWDAAREEIAVRVSLERMGRIPRPPHH